MNRRRFLAGMGALAGTTGSFAQSSGDGPPADFTLRIGPVDVEIAPRKIVKTTGYNGSIPGPLLKMPEGRPVTVDVYNETSVPELVHWHGLFVPSEVDGSAEEGTPFVPPRSHRRYQFVPRPAGTRWYHSHVYAGRNLHRSTYTGQFGFLQVVPKDDPARYDQEVLLALHGWNPYLSTKGGGGEGGEGSLEVAYGAFTINQHALGSGEPIRVKDCQRVLLRILNASATTVHRLALPGHAFTVMALDGNAVPHPRPVSILQLAPAERVDALVEMNQPGCWILGEVDAQMQKMGLGTVLEYAGRSGPPVWTAPPGETWDYLQFGSNQESPEPDDRVHLIFKQKWAGNRWVDHWTINGKEYPKTDPIVVRTGKRYRLILDNQSDDMHPIHLHRHSFELVKVAGKATAGVTKDVVNVLPKTQVEVQFVADHPGPSLFHCHMQLHMDFGFMTMVQYSDSPSSTPAAGHRQPG